MRALKNINIDDILLFDIETVSGEKELTEDSKFYESWSYKVRNSKEWDTKGFNEDILSSFQEKAALYPEFAKIVCISIGHVKLSDGIIKVSSFYGDDEADIINKFYGALDAFKASHKTPYLCGHAIKQFDVPYIFKRSLILGIEPHDLIDCSDSKPWDLKHLLDTKELYQGTSFTPSSLIGLTTAFGLENPKQDIAGHETSKAYYNGEILRIAKYCERDVVAVANVLLKMMRLSTVEKSVSAVDFAEVPLLEKIAKTKKHTKEELSKVLTTYNNLEEEDKPKASLIIEVAFGKKIEELEKEL